jgi:hypothetical protein
MKNTEKGIKEEEEEEEEERRGEEKKSSIQIQIYPSHILHFPINSLLFLRLTTYFLKFI